METNNTLTGQLISFTVENLDNKHLPELLWDKFSTCGIELKDCMKEIKMIRMRPSTSKVDKKACGQIMSAFQHWRHYNNYSLTNKNNVDGEEK